MRDYIILKLAENQVVTGRIVWYTDKGKFIEFEAIGIEDRWFTNEELEKLEVKKMLLRYLGLAILGYIVGMFLAKGAAAHEGSHFHYGHGLQDNTHLLSGGRTYQWIWAIHARTNVGGIIDSSALLNRTSSAFGNVQLGLDYEYKNLYADIYTGPGFVTKTDERLSTPYQFFSTASIGYRKHDYGVSLGYTHISNASTGGANQGRDFVLLGLHLGF